MIDPSAIPISSSTSPAGGRVVVLAAPARAEHVVRALDGLTATPCPWESVPAALDRIGEDCFAIVAVPAEGVAPPESLLAALARHERVAALPVLLVVDDGFPAARARTLHAAGAATVLAWPSEVRLLPGLVLQLSDASLTVRRGQPVDAALGDAIEARIAVDATPAGELRCRVDGSVAILRGETDSAWRAHRLRDLVGNVPGIERVDAGALHVLPPVVPDDELDQTIRDVLRSALGPALDGIEITTSAGEVTIVGTLRDDDERRRLEHLVENVPGVTRLAARLGVSDGEASR